MTAQLGARRAGSPKVFGIGLSRTGTTSLTRALEVLDYAAVHYPRIADEVAHARYDLAVLEEVDAITDTPVAAIYPHLDAHYPGSKFVLTVRDKDDWLDACERYFAVKEAADRGTPKEEELRFYFLVVYGCDGFHRERFSWVYDAHRRNVEHHFRGRPEDLLIFDVTAGDGWEKLCPFLGKPVPDLPFPHANSLPDFRERVRRRQPLLVV
jgi:hypothetical protein